MHTDVATMHRISIWREATRIVHEEGFRAFWKGNLVTVAHRLPYSAISFYAYEQYKNVSAKFLVRVTFDLLLFFIIFSTFWNLYIRIVIFLNR